MSKLDKHADLIKELYREVGTVKGTHANLVEKGVKVSYETLRQWLKVHQSELPALRKGGGRPKSVKAAKANHLFKLLDDGMSSWMPDAGMHPDWFLIFTEGLQPNQLTPYLVAALIRYEVEVAPEDFEDTKLPLTRMRSLCDLELYVFTYLLGIHTPWTGAAREEFTQLIRTITPMVIELKKVIQLRNTIKVGELRELLIAAEENCRQEVASRKR